MQLRRKPFAEWVLIYYDPLKTSAAKLLKVTRARGCPNAKIVSLEMKSLGSVKARILNPYICAGDTLYIELDSVEGVELELPKNWHLKKTVFLGKRVLKQIETTKWVKQGPAQVILKQGQKSLALKCEVVSHIY